MNLNINTIININNNPKKKKKESKNRPGGEEHGYLRFLDKAYAAVV